MTKDRIEQEKEKFAKAVIWINTIQASFRRANVYKSSATDKFKADFKEELKQKIEGIAKQYKGKVSSEQHIRNIDSIAEGYDKSEVLKEQKLKFGVCQKILNMYLKYLWVKGEIQEPPHFPVDYQMQEKMGYSPIIGWTTNDFTKEIYLDILEFAESKFSEVGANSFAEFELMVYSQNIKL